MAGIEEGISTVLAYAADDSHGYVLQGRSYDYGTDCAGLVRLYAATVEGVDVSGYPDFHTWNEASVLAARGWQDMAFDYGSAKRGDVFLRALGDSTGHTVVYLGGGRIVGAEGDWDGRAGDSSGTEVCERGYYDYSYNHILRPPAQGEEDEVTDSDITKIAQRVWEVSDGSWTADRVYRCTSMLKAMCGLDAEDTSDPKDKASSIRSWTIGRLERALRILKGMVGIDQEDTGDDAITTPMHVSLSDEDVRRVAEAVVEKLQGEE